jgi:hypothetical protein
VTSGDGEIILYHTEDGQSQIQLRAANGALAELFGERADPGRPNMGLTSWKGSRVRKNVKAADRFITVNDMRVLSGSGRISNEEATGRAHAHFASFDIQRRELEAVRAGEEATREMRALVDGRDERLLGDLERIEADIEGRRGTAERNERP